MSDTERMKRIAIENIIAGRSSIAIEAKRIGMPPSTLRNQVAIEKIKILEDKNSKPEATLLLFDLHIPHHDKDALETTLSYALENYKIIRVILGGDIMDCDALSKYEKTSDTKSFKEEVKETVIFLENLRERLGDDAEIRYIVGNHEERLEKYIAKHAPELIDVAGSIYDILHMKEIGVILTDNRKLRASGRPFYTLDGFTILHGHEIGICPTVSPAHRFLERAKGNLILGHIHCPDEKVVQTIDGKVLRCYSVGTLGTLNPMYKPVNTWGQGFAIMEHRKEQGPIVRNLRIFDGIIY